MRIVSSRLFKILPIVLFSFSFVSAQTLRTQVLVVGGTTGGIAAGLQSARNGANTIIVEQTSWLGGMLTAAGVSCTDGNEDFKSGIWQDFRTALKQHYKRKYLNTGWVSNTCFEPHVGDSIFKSWASAEKKLAVYYHWYFDKAIIKNKRVIGATFLNGQHQTLTVYATVVVDATDLGDVFASAGCKYDLGTEDPSQSGEPSAPGKTTIIQDLTWAATLQDFGKGADKTIDRPLGYDAKKYYCSTSDAPCEGTSYVFNTQKVLDYGKLPSTTGVTKYMLNWPAHGNDTYLNVVEHSPIEREQLYASAKNQTLGFIYFLQTELGMKHIGLANEFGSADKLAFMPYNREGRRVRGVVRLNIDHIRDPFATSLYRTGISVGDYPVDHHHAQYPGKVPDIPFPKVPSFSIPLGSLIPTDVKGLVVCEKGISVSNIANGTTRLQPVVLLTGQAAGMLASVSAKNKKDPALVDVRELQTALVENKCYILPYSDITPEDSAWKAVQLVCSLGFLKGHGVSEGWSNKTYFYPERIVTPQELAAVNQQINDAFPTGVPTKKNALFPTGQFTRKQLCVALCNYLDLSKIKVDLSGKISLKN
jgi:hypothetical protein